MTVSEDSVLSALVRLTNMAVGAKLSQNPGAVIKAGQNNNKPKTPYITIDSQGIRDDGGFLTFFWINPDTDKPEYHTQKQIGISFLAEGKGSLGILNDFVGYLRRDSARDYLREKVSAAIAENSDVRKFQTKLGDKELIEQATLYLVLNIDDVDIITDGSIYTIEEIDLDGELHRYCDDPDPLEFNINVSAIEP